MIDARATVEWGWRCRAHCAKRGRSGTRNEKRSERTCGEPSANEYEINAPAGAMQPKLTVFFKRRNHTKKSAAARSSLGALEKNSPEPALHMLVAFRSCSH